MDQNKYIPRREENENENIPQATKQRSIILRIYNCITQATNHQIKYKVK